MKNERRDYFRETSLVEAIRYTGDNYGEIYDWVMSFDLVDPGINKDEDGDLHISVTRFEMRAKFDWWIIRDIVGEFFYAVDDDTFKKYFTSTSTPGF